MFNRHINWFKHDFLCSKWNLLRLHFEIKNTSWRLLKQNRFNFEILISTTFIRCVHCYNHLSGVCICILLISWFLVAINFRRTAVWNLNLSIRTARIILLHLFCNYLFLTILILFIHITLFTISSIHIFCFSVHYILVLMASFI